MNETRDQFIIRAGAAVAGSADNLRALGLRVSAHYDYLSENQPWTYWLFVVGGDKWPSLVGRAIEGRGKSDGEALDEIRRKLALLTDPFHHAPMCPANHYHGERVPTGACTCGAVAMGVK